MIRDTMSVLVKLNLTKDGILDGISVCRSDGFIYEQFGKLGSNFLEYVFGKETDKMLAINFANEMANAFQLRHLDGNSN